MSSRVIPPPSVASASAVANCPAVVPKLPPRRCPQPHQHPMRLPRHHFFCHLFLRGSAKRQGRGPRRGLSAGPLQGQGTGRFSSVQHRSYNPREPRPLPLKGRPLAATPAFSMRRAQVVSTTAATNAEEKSTPVQTPCTRRCP